MLMPSIFGESLLDDFMDDFAFPYTGTRTYGKQAVNLMRTDVKDTPSAYELEIELPGVKKEDVKAELKDGYLTITASTDSKKEEKQENGSYIRRERYAGTCSRSLYEAGGYQGEVRERRPEGDGAEEGREARSREQQLYYHRGITSLWRKGQENGDAGRCPRPRLLK